MNNLAYYRLTVFVALFSTTALWITPYFDYMWLDAAQLSILRSDGYGALIPNSATLYWLEYTVLILALVGLFFQLKLAKTVFNVLMLLLVLSAPMWGVAISTPLEAMLSFVAGLSYGALLAIINSGLVVTEK